MKHVGCLADKYNIINPIVRIANYAYWDIALVFLVTYAINDRRRCCSRQGEEYANPSIGRPIWYLSNIQSLAEGASIAQKSNPTSTLVSRRIIDRQWNIGS